METTSELFYCGDGKSHFRVEHDNRVRLVLRPEERVILIGHWNAKDGILLLNKGKTRISKASYTFAVPNELFENLPAKIFAVETMDTKRYFAASRAMLRQYGFLDAQDNEYGQKYLFLDHQYWSELGSLDEVLDFESEQQAARAANRGE